MRHTAANARLDGTDGSKKEVLERSRRVAVVGLLAGQNEGQV
jgi:hypothetical protein